MSALYDEQHTNIPPAFITALLFSCLTLHTAGKSVCMDSEHPKNKASGGEPLVAMFGGQIQPRKGWIFTGEFKVFGDFDRTCLENALLSEYAS
ncbi:hypothetical protein DAEQUDRAFT_732423 [Daedalea quercina L-15889]|uniref:Uncharacterized protein n=1 Tax=Daedalea quercina L-15889 TaxID=1314783 RepID=A0A165LLI6_9APHY|nr:hypothetical protein DAEQUDRAFT_732423 [Daedalea quercina L-15889]